MPELASRKARQLEEAGSFIQNIHHFRDDALRNLDAPVERVVIFDEAQRAWTREQASKFMKIKRGVAEFDMSEPDYLISVMDRHKDWCVVICLVGGGQEINTGEAGLSQWLDALRSRYPHWKVYGSSKVSEEDYLARDGVIAYSGMDVEIRPELHLSVFSTRSFRAESLLGFIGHLVNNRPAEARSAYAEICDRHPIYLTRDLSEAKDWLRKKARGSERYGVPAFSGCPEA